MIHPLQNLRQSISTDWMKLTRVTVEGTTSVCKMACTHSRSSTPVRPRKRRKKRRRSRSVSTKNNKSTTTSTATLSQDFALNTLRRQLSS